MNDIIGDDIVCSVRGAVRRILQLAADPDAQESLFAVEGNGYPFWELLVGIMDSLVEYLEFNDYDVRLAAARSLKFLSSNKNIKAKLRDNMVVTSKMVIGFLILLTE